MRPFHPGRRKASRHAITGSDLELKQILECARAGASRARSLGREVLVGVSTAHVGDPLTFFSQAPQTSRYYWERPIEDIAMAGAGEAWHMDLVPRDEFESARRGIDWLRESALIKGLGQPVRGPVVFASFNFDPQRNADDVWAEFPTSRLVLPRFVLTRRGNTSFLTFSFLTGERLDTESLTADFNAMDHLFGSSDLDDGHRSRPVLLAASDNPIRDEWVNSVTRITGAIEAGEYEKVVLARRMDLEFNQGACVVDTIDYLRQNYPEATTLALAHPGGTFVSASPERLVSVRDDVLDMICLAGSAPRSSQESKDAELAEDLLQSAKNQREHQLVVEFAEERASNVCRDLETGEMAILSLKNVHHLMTRLQGRLNPGQSILDLAELLHFSPAVCGVPQAPARKAIREYEGFDRGCYGAPVGWMNLEGDGDFAIAIRAGLIRGSCVSLYAGCGIVLGSEPESEWQETILKFAPMTAALGAA